MARPKTDLPDGAVLRALVDSGGRLAVRVTPGARTEGFHIDGERLLARVRAKPEDGAANKAVAGLLAKALGCAPSQIELLRGATSREKLFRVEVG